MSYDASILALGPSHYYRLADTSGITAIDSSGYGRNATYIGSPLLNQTGLLTGDPNASVILNGAGNYVDIPDDNSLDGLTSLSIVALIKPTATDITSSAGTPVQIVSRDGGASNRSFQFRISASKLSFVKIPASTVTAAGATTLVADTVYHVAAVYDGGLAKVYLNGVLDGSAFSGSGTLNLGTFTSDCLIGRRQSDGTLLGGVDEVAIFAGQALTGSQISNLYTGSTTSPGVNPLTGTWGLVS